MLKLDLHASQDEQDAPLKIAVVGHVDDGKSTLIGRLLYETASLPEGKLEELKAISLKRSMPLEWSFVLDAFQAERDQAITIDTSQIKLKTSGRDLTLIDTPGHIEFLKNMVSGAANADAALLLLDAAQGVRQQTRRHAYLLSFLGVQQVIVIVNKMDLVDFSKKSFDEASTEIRAYLAEVGIKPQAIIPISARHGEMLVVPSQKMPWYQGVPVLEALHAVSPYDLPHEPLLRMPVQDVYKFDDRRIIVGRIESGMLRVGDELLFSPANQTAKVQSIETWSAPEKQEASVGESVGITLDRQLFVERGDLISHLENAPILTKQFRATLCWLGDTPLEQNKTYKIKIATRETYATVFSIAYEMNTETLQKTKSRHLAKNHCGEVILHLRDLVPVDEYQSLRKTGRFVLIDKYEMVAGGMISMKGFMNQRKEFIQGALNLTAVSHYVTLRQREQRSGHKGGVLWLTGLSGAGKSTLAMAVEQLLFMKGYQTYTLDGDNVRSGLNANLGFSPEDRSENIRRIGEVAALFADAGLICIAAFISPYAADRHRVRKMVSPGNFHEIYVKADVESCERRDPKGLYKKARKEVIRDFTGVSAPYEEPLHPDLIIDTVNFDVAHCVKQIAEYVSARMLGISESLLSTS